MFTRQQTKKIRIGNVFIGAGGPILVQSMANTATSDAAKTVEQIKRLTDAGCEIARVAVPDVKAASRLGLIKKKISLPLVADIHFDHNLALMAIDQGVDKIRINPGNIGSKEKVALIVEAAKKARIPIRVGVNAGSLKSAHSIGNGEGAYLKRAKALADAALGYTAYFESLDFFDIVVSLKASDVKTTVEAYKLYAEKKKYPLHLGITEAGSLFRGTIKSSVGLGALLYLGLGDTLRVSLTSDPVEEVKVAYQILQALDLRSTGIDIISCPTCARCEVDIVRVVNELEKKLPVLRAPGNLKKARPLKVAVMGCVVNGPGEAKEADIGIAGSKKAGVLFQNGRITASLKPKMWVPELLKLIKNELKTRS
jgi:(E)-4-hydroxy-3-methylbut-2-enyl-diphosphate synthase